jgi:SPP1 gp7 family putative phage head morphogenesis protein
MSYWYDRIDYQSGKAYNKRLHKVDKQLQFEYQRALKDIELDMVALYDKLVSEAANGEIRPNDLYKYNRYFEMHNKINQRLTALGGKEVKIYHAELLSMYQQVQDIITKEAPHVLGNAMVSEDMATKAIDAVWCADGKHWSDRVWKSKEALQTSIEKGLMDCIVRGVPKDEFVKELMKRFNVSYAQADRLARTELSFIQNQATADRYQSAGIEKYEILAARDARTSDICREQDGKIYEFSKMQVGVNYPPFHPNCRTTVIPVLKEGK